MKPTQLFTVPNLPRVAAPLMRYCECGHQQFKHVRFCEGCREAGCHCELFQERTETEERKRKS